MTRAIVIRDAVWGDIALEAAEAQVLGTREMQRMRGIRQLGTAHLVYPSANHTRFEHMLGTCHLARRILDGLRARQPELDLSDELVAGTCTAALVHDVGHVPYGHTFEDERRIFPRHDGPERTDHFLGDTELGRVLERQGLRGFVRSALGHGEGAPQLVRDIVSGTICADLLDYLARDAYFTGIRRLYDERVFRYFAVRDGRLVLCLAKRGLTRADAFSEVIHLLRLRYTLSERVYFHHAKVASGALVSKLVERAVHGGLELRELFPFGDEALLGHLAAKYAPSDPILARLLGDLRSRRLPKRAYVLTRGIGLELQSDLITRFHADGQQRERVEAELEHELGLETGDLILYCPGPGMSLKEADILVEQRDGSVGSLGDMQLREVDELRERHRDLWKFSVLVAARAEDRRADVAKACAERFGPESELS